MTTAVEIIEKLLDGPIQEATPTVPTPAPDKSPLRVFGNDAPPKGWFYTGPDPFGEFIRYKRGQEVRLKSPQDRQHYIEYFVRNGYTLVFKQGNSFNIYSRENVRLPQDGVKALEMTMALNPDSMVSWGGRSMKAGKIIYGQPSRSAKTEPESEETLHEPDTQGIKATFGGIYGEDGQFETGSKVNASAIKKLLADGYAFVVKYPSGSFNVVMPEHYRFQDSAIRAMERKMGLNPSARVQWFIGAIKPSEAIQTTASEAIYGDKV